LIPINVGESLKPGYEDEHQKVVESIKYSDFIEQNTDILVAFGSFHNVPINSSFIYKTYKNNTLIKSETVTNGSNSEGALTPVIKVDGPGSYGAEVIYKDIVVLAKNIDILP
jgi:hypothetical protein